MTSLTLLSAETVHRIASSQVITSVSTAVKELVENSLDAGATSIEIKLEDYGLFKIEVRDNGGGITPQDAQFMAQRHYTSKISSFENLDSLASYGFRGEALCSLCNVSHVSVTTKTEQQEIATCYTLDQNGKVLATKLVPSTTGTTITACHLFKNLPVRKQFSRNTKKCKDELKKVEDLAMSYGLIHPDLRIILRHNKTVVWQKNKCPDYRTTLVSVLGSSVFSCMEKAEFVDDASGIEVKAYLPRPDADISITSRTTKDRCFIYVNKRPVNIKEVSQAIRENYMRCIGASNRYPISFLSITVPPGGVDVNLEPNKTRVLLTEKETILDSLTNLLQSFYTLKNKVNDGCFVECNKITECINIEETFGSGKEDDEIPVCGHIQVKDFESTPSKTINGIEKEAGLSINELPSFSFSFNGKQGEVCNLKSVLSGDTQIPSNSVSAVDGQETRCDQSLVDSEIELSDEKKQETSRNESRDVCSGAGASTLFSSYGSTCSPINEMLSCCDNINQVCKNNEKISGEVCMHQKDNANNCSSKLDQQDLALSSGCGSLLFSSCGSSSMEEMLCCDGSNQVDRKQDNENDNAEMSSTQKGDTENCSSQLNSQDVSNIANLLDGSTSQSCVGKEQNHITESTPSTNDGPINFRSGPEKKSSNEAESAKDKDFLDVEDLFDDEEEFDQILTQAVEKRMTSTQLSTATEQRAATTTLTASSETSGEVISAKDWAEGLLRSEQGRVIEPTRLLTSAALQNKDKKTSGKRKLSSDKENSRLQASSKKIKMVPQVAANQSLITLHAKRSPQMRKMSAKTVVIPFTVTSHRSSKHLGQSLMEEDCIIGRVEPSGVWLQRQGSAVTFINQYRIQEQLMFHRLLSHHSLPTGRIERPIIMDQSTAGGEGNMNVLKNMSWKQNDDRTWLIDDTRITHNGFDIRKKIDPESNDAKIEVHGISSSIPFYGVPDLVEILGVIRTNGQADCSLARSRPLKVVNYLKSEAVRVARGLSSHMDREEIYTILQQMKEYLPVGCTTCIHGQPFFGVVANIPALVRT